MKPFAVFSSLSVVSVFTALLTMFLVLGIFEQQLGTPVVSRPGEEPFAYDTDVLPFMPCCGSLAYLVFVNLLHRVWLASTPPFSRRWWVVSCLLLAIPFVVPALLIFSAIFLNPPAP